MYLGHYQQALDIMNMLDAACQQHNLVTDNNRNLVLEAVIYKQMGNKEVALSKLKNALLLTNNTGMVGNFLCDAESSVHFDEDFVEKLLTLPNIPELIRTSPLTQREWQVLGLIYSGYSNEQIASELDVAATTIKTHIRNLYQKLGIANRQEAITTAEELIGLMGI